MTNLFIFITLGIVVGLGIRRDWCKSYMSEEQDAPEIRQMYDYTQDAGRERDGVIYVG